jgi:hypothetical protein
VPGRLPRSRSEQFGGPPTGAKTIHLPPMLRLCAGFRAWNVNSDGGVFSASSTMSRPIRTRSPETLAPAFAKISRASGSRISMPSSSSTFSDWRWIASI